MGHPQPLIIRRTRMIKGLYIATYSEKATETIRENGLGIELDDICISEMLDEERIEETLANMREEVRASGAKDVIIHGPFTEIIPSSIDHRAVDMGFQRLNQAYGACRAMGVNRMVVHSGYMPPLYLKGWHTDRSVWFWNRYMKNKPDDFHICIENVLEDEPVMMKELIDRLADPRISLCFDVGHANWSTNGEYVLKDWIKILGDDITHFHLHNNDGKRDLHNAVGDGAVNMAEIMEAVVKYCKRDVTLTIESRAYDENALRFKNYVGENPRRLL